ncbi:hypothetical protein [Roseiconus lacunae]|uniref:hypothetical protein n=1 Tax=Roseiconus lacunae TaxID=2605694 RepID=UPI0011F3ED81|nr:hypothetical protein [Roseiconus lacunae]
MKSSILRSMAFATSMFLGSVANAAIVMEFDDVSFSGPGLYTFDMTVTAVGQTESISGFTMPLQVANGTTFVPETPDTSLSDIQFTPNALLETKGASSDFTANGFGFSITSVDANGSPLVLNDGESAVLFSIPMNVLTSGDALVESPALSALFSLTGASSVQFGPGFSGNVVTAIPESGSTIALGCLGIGLMYRRKRR